MDMEILPLGEADFPEIVEVWEASVGATHGFVSAEYLARLKGELASKYLPGLRLFGIRAVGGRLAVFCGVSPGKVEMLFAHPDFFGRGFGRAALLHAINGLGASRVDVNEENPKALAFYAGFGFECVCREETDGEGRPHPILHLELSRGSAAE